MQSQNTSTRMPEEGLEPQLAAGNSLDYQASAPFRSKKPPVGPSGVISA